MLSCDRRNILLTLLALSVAGCGFSPVYSGVGAARALNGNLRFNLIDSADGFTLFSALEKRFGKPRPDAVYDVAVELTITDDALVLVAATGLTRHTLNGKATFTVTNAGGQTQVFTAEVRETAGYTSSPQTLVTDAAATDAHRRLVTEIADRIALSLSSNAASWAA